MAEDIAEDISEDEVGVEVIKGFVDIRDFKGDEIRREVIGGGIFLANADGVWIDIESGDITEA